MKLAHLGPGLLKGVAGAMAVGLMLAFPAAASNEQAVRSVADDCEGGSSNATGYASNKRLVKTSKGRQLAIYDPHGSGIHLRWRDPGKAWNNNTRGAVTNGNIVMTDGPNDRPATIALTTVSGNQRAFIVWAGYSFARPSAVMMRRLTSLNDPRGPRIGPQVVLVPQGLGNVRADIAFERRPSGPHAVVTWLHKNAEDDYDLMTGWLSTLDARPTLKNPMVQYHTTSENPTGTLVSTTAGVALVARAGDLRMFTHSSSDGGLVWGSGSASVHVASQSKPSAILQRTGSVLVAVESDVTQHVVKVYRFNASGTTVSKRLDTGAGYMEPSLARTNNGALLAMVRSSDEALLTRRLKDSKWGRDVVELKTEGGGDYAWPNLMKKAQTHLNMLIDAGRCPNNKQSNAVISYTRSL